MKLRIHADLILSPEHLEMLREGTRGHELVFPSKPVASVLAKAERDPQFVTADVSFGQPDLAAIDEAKDLKWIHVSSSGITRYDTPEFRTKMKARGIPVTNSAAVYQEACATHVFSFLLAQARNLPLGLKTRTPNGTALWHQMRGASVPLAGQTVLILGFGSIAKRLVEMLRPLNMNILAYRRRARGDEGVPVITEAALAETLATQADHVINILPDSVETRLFFDESRFAEMKEGAVFYNIGRGTTVDQGALRDALHSGRMAAAWLDVTDPEPLPDAHPLWQEPNCHITPHLAGGHRNETGTLVRHFLGNLQRFANGEPLVDQVMP